jgi:hypothetical protein
VNDEENWLHAEQVACPSCHQALYRVDHSPFYDAVFFYCASCPIHAEVSFYDPVYGQVTKAHPHPAGKERMRALEALLKPCSCGGTFRHDAVRRCLRCHGPVIVEYPAGVDLFFWSDALLPGAPDMSHEEWEAGVQRHALFERTQDLWKDA